MNAGRKLGRVRHACAFLTLIATPSLASAQRAASERVGIQPYEALATRARADTVSIDSVAPSHGSRAYDAVAGGIIGVIAGGVTGLIYAQQAQKSCGDGPCLVGLAIPFGAAIGLVGGVVIGAIWPTN